MRLIPKPACGLLMAASLMVVSAPKAIAAAEPLSADDVAVELASLPGWQTNGVSLSCTYRFANFLEAIAFINQLVEPAERLGHHPDLSISYNVVDLLLTTHDAGGLTTLDTQLAKEVSQLASESGISSCAPE